VVAPTAHSLFNPPLPLGLRGKPGKPGAADEARRRVQENECGCSFRIGSCEQRGERAPVAEATNNCTIRARGVHDRSDVVHAYLERGPGNTVRHPGSALVEKEQAANRCEPGEEPRLGRVLPNELYVMGQTRDEDQVERPFADHLVGDVDVAASGVVGARSFVDRACSRHDDFGTS
jgi:hypothetical protein